MRLGIPAAKGKETLSMSYKHETTRRRESTTCPGVAFYLRKMTEGRRLELREKLAATNAKVREILREQGKLLEMPPEQQDQTKIMELQDQFEGLMIEVSNPTTIEWGVKKVEGLEVDGNPLDVKDWREWPSVFFNEVLQAVNDETALNGGEIKNLQSGTTSGVLEDGNPENTIVATAGKSAGI